MWETIITPSHRSNSMRRIFTIFLATFVAVFTCALISTTSTFALDASWKSSSVINYDNNSYTGPVSEETVKNLELTTGSTAYTFVDPIEGIKSGESRKIRVIYFAPNTVTDTVTTASYKTLTYLGANSYSSPSASTSIVISEKSKTAAATSCAIDGGLGWLICPVTNFLANGMDWIFNIIKSFMIVRPVSSDQDSSLYRAWSYMRSIANIAFVIAFLLIIYSQITNQGISNYGIKKLLPRLIIAAILVNISYFICALAVDLSNILGASLQDVFISIRNSVVGTGGNSWDLMNWNSITGFVLSGGTIATASTIALTSTLATYGVVGSIALLFPTLVIGMMAILVALVVMAARQALITILIVLAPLAFVAYLLPNTEKWFEKWKSTFTTMLILFPAFSVIFGGSQLASSLIIQNADSINTLILGMIIQVVPLFLTPFLIQMSGSIVGKVAGFVNNPKTGPIDRARNFTKDRTDVIAARRLGQEAKPHQFLRRHAQRVDHNRRRREGWKSSYGTMSDARWSNSSAYSDIDQNTREYQERKSLGEAHSELRYSQSRITSGRLQELDVRIRETKLLNDSAKATSELRWEQNQTSQIKEARFNNSLLSDQISLAKAININDYEILKSKNYDAGSINIDKEKINAILEATRSTAEALAIQSSRKAFIGQSLNVDFADALLKSPEKSGIAGASEVVVNGAENALAAAVTIVNADHAKDVKNRSALLNHFNVSSPEHQILAMGGEVVRDAQGNRLLDRNGQPIVVKVAPIVGTTKTTDGTEIKFVFNADDEFNMEAAIARQFKFGIYDEYRDIVESSGKGGALEKFATTIAAEAAANGIGNKAPFMGGRSYGDMSLGEYLGHKHTLKAAANFIGDGKFKAEDIALYETAALSDLMEAIREVKDIYDPIADGKKIEKFNRRLPRFLKNAYIVLDESNSVGTNISDGSRDLLEELLISNNIPLPPVPNKSTPSPEDGEEVDPGNQ